MGAEKPGFPGNPPIQDDRHYLLGPVRTSLRKRPTARIKRESSASVLKGTYSHAQIAIGRLPWERGVQQNWDGAELARWWSLNFDELALIETRRYEPGLVLLRR